MKKFLRIFSILVISLFFTLTPSYTQINLDEIENKSDKKEETKKTVSSKTRNTKKTTQKKNTKNIQSKNNKKSKNTKKSIRKTNQSKYKVPKIEEGIYKFDSKGNQITNTKIIKSTQTVKSTSTSSLDLRIGNENKEIKIPKN